jgi:hypothetical protein
MSERLGHLQSRETFVHEGNDDRALFGDIPELNVILAGWWRPVSDADSGQRRLTPFPNVA